ncbi:hypothetical protein ACFXAN_16720, partial [Streptomyces misionensis]
GPVPPGPPPPGAPAPGPGPPPPGPPRPRRPPCQGSFEAEGIDYDRRTGTLRVIVVSPGVCVLTDSKTYKFSLG